MSALPPGDRFRMMKLRFMASSPGSEKSLSSCRACIFTCIIVSTDERCTMLVSSSSAMMRSSVRWGA